MSDRIYHRNRPTLPLATQRHLPQASVAGHRVDLLAGFFQKGFEPAPTPKRRLAGAGSNPHSILGGKEIRVALYADLGATKKDLPEVELCLLPSMGFDVERVTADEIRSGGLSEFDVLIQPGGSGSQQAQTLGEERRRVRALVNDGGGFVGICAGAFLASTQYRWSLGILNAAVVDDEHWERGIGKVQLRLPPAGRAVLALDQELVPIHYNNGPLLGPGNEKQLAKYELLATFETEIVKNGAPAGVMRGTAAIARGELGKGRVICFSPHPEKTPGGDSYLRAAVRWAAHADEQ